LSKPDAHAQTFAFPRAARLLSPKQFQATFSQGRRISAALFRLHLNLATADTMPIVETARLGLAVSKRVAATAVARNRIKRIARDSFRKRRLQLPAGDYVLLAQREATAAPSASLRAALDTLWDRVIALKPQAPAPTIPRPAPDPATHRG
jgi:ribonuclease P protein component